MRRASSSLFLLAVPFLVSCSRPTEIVVKLDTTGAAPSEILVKLHRSEPFPADLPSTPGYVVAALNGADLDLHVTPQGDETSFSLLPTKDGPTDLRVTVSVPGVPGYTIMPAGGQDVMFVDGASQELQFTLTAPQPDMGVKDAGSRDAAADGGTKDAAAPTDARAGG